MTPENKAEIEKTLDEVEMFLIGAWTKLAWVGCELRLADQRNDKMEEIENSIIRLRDRLKEIRK